MSFTLLVDESGLFDQPHAGVRIVAGLLLGGTPAEIDAFAAPRLAAALGWWPGNLHAVEYGKADGVFRVISRGAPPPPKLFALAPQLGTFRSYRELFASPSVQAATLKAALAAEGSRLLAEASKVVTGTVKRFNGSILLCAEHDLPLTSSRYPAMATSLLQASAWIAGLGGAPAEIDAVLEARSDSPEAAPEILARPGLPPASFRSYETRPGKRDAGLALADVVNYRLGPLAGAEDPIAGPALHASWSLRAKTAQADRLFPGVRLWCLGAGRTHEILSGHGDLAELSALRSPLPAGEVPCAVDGSIKLAEQLARSVR